MELWPQDSLHDDIESGGGGWPVRSPRTCDGIGMLTI